MISRKSSIHNVLGSMITSTILFGAAPLLSPHIAGAQMIFSTQSRSSDRDGRIGEGDIKSLVQTLGLDSDQEALVRGLYEGHRAAWDDADQERRESIQALFQDGQKADGSPEMTRKLIGIRKQAQVTRDRLENDFFESVKGIITTDQLANWPRFERDRRRHSMQAMHSALGGESVDLIDVSESIDLSKQALSRLDPVSSVYAEELDLAIVDRARAFEAVEKQTTPPDNGDFAGLDLEAVKKAQDKLHEKRCAVREVNERYAALFSSQLTAEDAQNFNALYLERSFPSVYRPTAADRYIKQVRALETLNEEQLRALDSIDEDYGRQVGIINDQLVQIIRQDEEKVDEPGMFFGGSTPGGAANVGVAIGSKASDGEGSGATVGVFITAVQDEKSSGPPSGGQTHQIRAAQPLQPIVLTSGNDPQDDSPQGKLRKSKSELVDRTIEAVAALLSPEQLALAPKPDELARLAPEEQMRRMVEKALQNAVFELSEDGSSGVTFTIGGDK